MAEAVVVVVAIGGMAAAMVGACWIVARGRAFRRRSPTAIPVDADRRAQLETLVRADDARCHPKGRA